MQYFVSLCVVSVCLVNSGLSAPRGGGRWKAVPYVANYGSDPDRQGYPGGGFTGGHVDYLEYHFSGYGQGHGHRGGRLSYSGSGGSGHGHGHGHGQHGHSYHYPIPSIGGKATYIQKLVPIFQLGGGVLASFLQSKSSHKHGWHFEDAPHHNAIWSASGHPHPVPVGHNDW